MRAEEQEVQVQLTDTVAKREEARKSRRAIEEETAALNSKWQELREQRSSPGGQAGLAHRTARRHEGFAVGVRAVMMAKQKEFPGMQGIITRSAT